VLKKEKYTVVVHCYRTNEQILKPYTVYTVTKHSELG